VRAVAASLLLLLLFALSPADALAQPRPSPDDLAEARALYQAGLEDVEQARWADALRSFERSYALAPVGATLFNLATSLRALGRHREARDAFDQLLAQHRAELPAELRSRAETMRRESAARVAVLALVDLPRDPRPEIRLDGGAHDDDGTRPLELETDSGDHALVVEAEGRRPFRWQGHLADGAREEIAVALVPLPDGGGTTTGGDGGALPLWLGIAGGVVLVAGVVLAIIVIGSSNDLEPNGDVVLRL
jgi:tetratricopeptide (TPR) repeat protein